MLSLTNGRNRRQERQLRYFVGQYFVYLLAAVTPL